MVEAGQGCEADREHPGADHHLAAADGLIQLSRLVQGIHARISERHDLTPVQAKLLCVLAFGPRGMAELAQCFGVEKAALTGLVDRAERRGLVRRSPVPGTGGAARDAHRHRPRGSPAFHAEVTQELGHLLAPLAPHDREHFRNAIATIIAAREATSLGGAPLAAAYRPESAKSALTP